MSKIDLVAGDWVDLVFEGKNQACCSSGVLDCCN